MLFKSQIKIATNYICHLKIINQILEEFKDTWMSIIFIHISKPFLSYYFKNNITTILLKMPKVNLVHVK